MVLEDFFLKIVCVLFSFCSSQVSVCPYVPPFKPSFFLSFPAFPLWFLLLGLLKPDPVYYSFQLVDASNLAMIFKIWFNFWYRIPKEESALFFPGF